MLVPNITWGQDKAFIYITFDFAAHHSVSKFHPYPISSSFDSLSKFKESDVQIDITNKDIKVKTELYEVFFDFFHEVEPEILHKFFGDGILRIKLKKAQKKKIWKNVCGEAAGKKLMQVIKKDWGKWNVNTSSSESSCPSSPCYSEEEEKIIKNEKRSKKMKNNANKNINSNLLLLNLAITDKDKKILNDSPPLDDNLSFLDYFKNNLTSAQKMLTLIEMWNASDIEERKMYMKNMINIVENDENVDIKIKKLTNSIKGGEESLYNLNAHDYEKSDVTFCANWVDAFSFFDANKKTEVLSMLFSALSDEEKQIVLSTFF